MAAKGEANVDGYSRDRKVSIKVGCSDEMFDCSLVFTDGSVYEAHVGEDLGRICDTLVESYM